ncbi:protein-glutamate O-methyltransferase CheR [Gottschalkiaceae bacterium SANA]|nr:protein-glutamate O-methyltransferase CheR [Gottschalkiaceae bacterium SANA]
MERIKDYFKVHFDKDLSCYQEEFLKRSIEKRMAENGIDNEALYAAKLENNQEEAECFLSALSVYYSEFFREPFAFWYLEKHIIPEIMRKKKQGQEIRIWSVGCSIGQEPYSIAILLNEMIQRSKIDINVRIFASDISGTLLERGRLGNYSRLEMKQLKLEYLDKYFTESGDHYEVSPSIKNQVTFLAYDILDANTICPAESIFGEFDIIFCRNLMIYYHADYQKMILNKLERSLVSGGYLITGEAESAYAEMWLKHKPLMLSGAVFKSDFDRRM